MLCKGLLGSNVRDREQGAGRRGVHREGANEGFRRAAEGVGDDVRGSETCLTSVENSEMKER